MICYSFENGLHLLPAPPADGRGVLAILTPRRPTPRRCPPGCPRQLRLPTRMSLSSAGCTSTAPASPATCARRRVPISLPAVWASHGRAEV